MIVFMILICLLVLIIFHQKVSPDKEKPNYPNYTYKHDISNPYFNPYLPYETLHTAQKDAQSKEKETQAKKEQMLLRILYTLLFVSCLIACLSYF